MAGAQHGRVKTSMFALPPADSFGSLTKLALTARPSWVTINHLKILLAAASSIPLCLRKTKEAG